MEHYYPYDIFSTERIEETLTVEDGLIQLRHTPKYRSVVIDGFNETDSISLQLNQFRVDYSLDTYYRESNRLLHFNPARNGEELTISYITCGTPITAEDMNEIKKHLDSDHSAYYQLPIATADTRGGVRLGQGLYMTGDILNVGSSIEGGISNYELPIASATQLGGIKIGNGLSISGDGILSANATSNYVLPTATTSTKGGVIVGRGLSMTGDTLSADDYTLPVASNETLGGVKVNGNGLAMDGEFLRAMLGQGLHFDEYGRIAIYLGNGVVYAAKAMGLRSNSDGSISILVDNQAVSIDENNAITINVSQGIETTPEGLKVKTGNGLAFDADGGLFIYCGRGLSYDELNRLQVNVGKGLTFDNSNNIIVNAGKGLGFDEDGKLCVVKEISSDGWEYQDSGYDVIPAAPLIYVDETHFYQPEGNGIMNDMFDTPEGVMEFWMRGDIFISSDAVNGNTFRFGYYSAENNWYVSIGNGYSASGGLNDIKYNQLLYLVNSSPYTYANGTSLYLTKNAENHFLFHAVSHPTAGYIEITLNYGTYRKTGNVNNGKPFDCLFVYSGSKNCLFSNFVVSSTQLEY